MADAEDRVQTLMANLADSVERAKAAAAEKRKRDASRPWQHVQRDQCRPDEKCISCGMEMGDVHAINCYTAAIARQAHSERSTDA